MLFWLIVLVVVVALGALAWWSSGRTRRRSAPGLDPHDATSRGWATNQALINRDSAGGGGAGF